MKSFLEFDQQITEEVLDEVLSKDAEAGEWIDDFVKSDNPKFAGKSKEKRKEMALAAYYAKQRNEEADLEESDAEWEKSMEKQKHDRINDKDKDTLGKLAGLMAKEKKNRPIKEAVEMTQAQIMKKIKDGTHEVTTDIKPGKHVELRHNATGKTKMVMVKHNPMKEEALDEAMDKMFKHVHPNVSDPKLAHKQAMDVVKNNQGKVRKISDTHSEVDFPGGKSAVFKTSKEGDKVVTHIAHHSTYSESVNLDESAEDKAAAEVHQNLVYGSIKHGAQDVPHHIKAVMKAHGAKDYNKVVDIVRKKGYAGKIDEEALDELSKGTLGSYVKKASEQGKKAAVSKNQSDRGATDALTKGNERLHNLHTDNWNYQNKLEKKRAAGISKAVDKLTKEEALDELSKDTLGSYVKKSFAQGNELHQDLSYMRGDKATDAERKAVRDKISKRNLGVIKANKKLKEENQMISYSEFMAKLDESNASERAAEILAAKRAERLDKYDFSKEKQKPVSAVKQVKGRSYGADKPDNEDDEDENKKSSEPEVKRGRGRPSGSKSGARV